MSEVRTTYIGKIALLSKARNFQARYASVHT